MGRYVNPDSTLMEGVLCKRIFVDKTLILSALNDCIDNHEQYVCMTRPRRFGKSYVGFMMMAYYSKGADSRSLFQNLKIGSQPSF